MAAKPCETAHFPVFLDNGNPQLLRIYFALPLIPSLVISGCLLKTMSHMLFVASYDVPIFDNLTTLIAVVVYSALLIFTFIYLVYVFITSQAMRKEIIPTTLEK